MSYGKEGKKDGHMKHEKSEKGGKMAPRMERAFQKVEHEPARTYHKGRVSGCME